MAKEALDQIKDSLKRQDEADATEYYMNKVIRKKDLGGKYNPLTLDSRYDYLNDIEEEDEDIME